MLKHKLWTAMRLLTGISYVLRRTRIAVLGARSAPKRYCKTSQGLCRDIKGRAFGWFIAFTTGVFLAGFFLRSLLPAGPVAHAQSHRVFEIRTYTAPDGKLPDLQARFRNHTTRIFERHGIANIGYWVPQDAPQSQNTLIYIVAHRSREAATQSWAAFGADPEWRKVAAESQVNGRLTSKIESVFVDPTDFSPLK